ncbi:MAG: DUF4296 domain-containing protein [Candidatus Competibacteraceae bacterium]|nr:DUF4296 domain-containing protein [Candidatus Competibacteraceae bacterium]
MFRLILIWVACCILILSACDSNKSKQSIPPNLLQPEQMKAILVDIHLAKGAKMNGILPTSLSQHPDSLLLAITKDHQTDTVVFRKSYAFYVSHPVIFAEIYAGVVDALKME